MDDDQSATDTNPRQGDYGLPDLEGDLGAGWNAGVNTATLGLADKVGAASAATLSALRGQDWYNRYKDVRDQQTARDQFDASHHAFARRVGQAVGTIAGIAATDGLTAAPAASARIAFTAPELEPTVASMIRYLRPWGAAAGVGAGAGVVGQGAADAASGHISDPQTYASDALGGAAGGIGTLARSPALGAAADAVVNGAAHSALTGQPISPIDMAENALAGGYLGLLGHVAGTQWADNLDWREKGRLGEFMAKRTSNILGDDVAKGLRFDVSGGKTLSDHVADGAPVEAKFGYKARLSKRQNEAFNELPDYRVYHFLPPDVGRITGGLLAMANAQSHQDK
jgi:hypothetical protein